MVEAAADRLGVQKTPYLRRAAFPLVLIGLLLVISITAIRSSWSAGEFVARTTTETMVIGANRQVTMLFEGARLGLDRLAEAVDRVSETDPVSLSDAATRIARENPFIVGAIVQDRRGVIIAAAEPGSGLGLDLGHLDYVRTLLEPGAARYWIGEPFDSPIMGDVLIPLARTVTDIRGEPVAILAVGVSRKAILQTLIAPNDGFETFLWRADGTLLVVPDGVRIATGRRYPDAPLWRYWRPEIDVGVYEGRNPVDGQPRLVGWRTNFVFPLIVTGGIDKSRLTSDSSLTLRTLMALAVIGVLSLAMGYVLDVRHLAAQLGLIARLTTTTARLQDAMAARSSFLANMSHELRTPLNAVIGYTEMMRMGIYGTLPPKMEEAARNVELAGRAQLQLVEQLLDFSRIEAGQLVLRPENLSAVSLLEETFAMIAPIARAEGVELDILPPDGADGVICDRARTSQILLNLLSNAVRHSPAGGCVTGHVRRAGDERLVIEIADRGSGLPHGPLEHLFEFAAKPDAYVTGPGRNGLGLPISRSLARLQGGDLTLAARPGGGTVATLLLPVGAAAPTD
jgi:signal transduction histidine kinase